MKRNHKSNLLLSALLVPSTLTQCGVVWESIKGGCNNVAERAVNGLDTTTEYVSGLSQYTRKFFGWNKNSRACAQDLSSTDATVADQAMQQASNATNQNSQNVETAIQALTQNAQNTQNILKEINKNSQQTQQHMQDLAKIAERNQAILGGAIVVTAVSGAIYGGYRGIVWAKNKMWPTQPDQAAPTQSLNTNQINNENKANHVVMAQSYAELQYEPAAKVTRTYNYDERDMLRMFNA